MTTFTTRPQGPFELAHQNEFFGGWPTTADGSGIVMTFPVEGWQSSACVTLHRDADGAIHGEVVGDDPERAWHQALATLSLDVDATAWPDVGDRDPRIGTLQAEYRHLRPVLFHSPWEAAAGFVIGHRISITQRRNLMERMAVQLGDEIIDDGATRHAFPRPQVLATLEQFPGISDVKVERLRAVAAAATAGTLDRSHLREVPVEQAQAELLALPGIGPFFAQGILFRGAGLVDRVTEDAMTLEALRQVYGLDELPTVEALHAHAEAWRPFSMWAVVLMHIWLRREGVAPTRAARR